MGPLTFWSFMTPHKVDIKQTVITTDGMLGTEDIQVFHILKLQRGRLLSF